MSPWHKITPKPFLQVYTRIGFGRNPGLFLPSATKLRRLCFYTCLSVHRGSASVQGYHPPEQTLRLGADTTPPPTVGTFPGADLPPEQAPPWKQTPDTRHPPADGYCCGRYASYWNAFLYMFKNLMKVQKNRNSLLYNFLFI